MPSPRSTILIVLGLFFAPIVSCSSSDPPSSPGGSAGVKASEGGFTSTHGGTGGTSSISRGGTGGSTSSTNRGGTGGTLVTGSGGSAGATDMAPSEAGNGGDGLSTSGGADGAAGSGGSGDSCLKITLTSNVQKVHPAGIAIDFKVLQCDDSPLVPPLAEDEITLINGETNEPFASEGAGASRLAPPGNLKLYSVLMLDMSGSIFEYDAQDSVLAGARAYIDALVTLNPKDSTPVATIKRNHEVALYIFSHGTPIPLQDFTNDSTLLYAGLDKAVVLTPMGSTDLYGAYQFGLTQLRDKPAPVDSLVERFMVILTDGTHQAGNGEQLRQQSLALKDQNKKSHIFSIGIEAAFDEESVRELAQPDGFFSAADKPQIQKRFLDIAGRVEAIARSNYAVVVCTPVYLAPSQAILRVTRAGIEDEQSIPYNPLMLELNGDTRSCDPALLLARHTLQEPSHCTNKCVLDKDCNATGTYGVLRTCEGTLCRAYCEKDADCKPNPLATSDDDWVCEDYKGLRRCMVACDSKTCTCPSDMRTPDMLACAEACATPQDCSALGADGRCE
jgi:hypothetical protein